MNSDDDEFDPRELPANQQQQSRRIRKRPKRAAQDDGRLPLLKKAWDWLQGTETAKRRRLRAEGNTLEYEAEFFDKRRKTVKEERKLVDEETELTKAKRSNKIEDLDDEDATDFERAKRLAERDDYFEDRRMHRERSRAKHDQKMNPRRGKGKYERLKDGVRNWQTYGSDGIHMKAWKEVFDEAAEKYGGERKIPDDEYDNLMRAREDALRRDHSQG